MDMFISLFRLVYCFSIRPNIPFHCVYSEIHLFLENFRQQALHYNMSHLDICIILVQLLFHLRNILKSMFHWILLLFLFRFIFLTSIVLNKTFLACFLINILAIKFRLFESFLRLVNNYLIFL
jgi:hypothetical protein